MTKVAKELNAKVVDLDGIAKAVSVDAEKLNLGVRNDLLLEVENGGEKQYYALEYVKDQNAYFNPQLPYNLPDEKILEGSIKINQK
ncbi:hypothetical protein [Pontibacillus sp. HMF3514]|uniref:hypothetical protein n=1 Tax=Pontibacillus sp. HMF3514 TaxID=2692425 RepID=UPI00131FDD94|nr:hypothetical protein [Pontibacillus sp. HMF3514]QHE53745.1 hypothetical protein GS400_17740 [Pontibacillus sp. HMF3514]